MQSHLEWTRPVGDTLKVNVDGAFRAAENTGRWGFAVRDAKGDVQGSGAGGRLNVCSAIQTEATACLEAMHAAATWGMMKIQIESDCQNLTSTLLSTEYDLTREGTLFREF